MYRRLLGCLVLAVGLCLTAPARVHAQTPPSPPHRPQAQHAPQSQQVEPASNATPPKQHAKFPKSAADRLARAVQAFQDADYHILRPLLEPTLEPTSKFSNAKDERKARTLLGVGLYFEAQQVTDATRRKKLLDGAESQFLAILRKDPDHSLNPLIYPASIIELFEAVKEEHADELDKIRASRADKGDGAAQHGLQTVYIERDVGIHNYAVNYLPFGLGQFQNHENVQGTLFATSQVLALGLNMTSYWMIESLRSADGYYDPGPGNAAETARNWRVMQYVGLGVFVGIYAWSVIDALVDYHPTEVRIRSLDKPPPELNAGGADDKGPSLQIGLGGIGMAW